MHANEYPVLDQLLINLISQKKPPDYQIGIKNKRQNSVKFNTTKQLFKGIQWQQFSPGVGLYFLLLKYLTVLFIILFINSAPSILCNLKGKGLNIYSQNNQSHKKVGIMRISLANLPITSFETKKQQQSLIKKQLILVHQEFVDPNQIYSHTSVHRFIICFNDIYLTLIVILFFIFWEIKSKQIVNKNTTIQTDKIIDLPSYRTIIVKNIFQNDKKQIALNIIKENQQDTQRKFNNQNEQNIELIWQNIIKRHFQKFAQVDSVSIVYDYGETLYQLTQFNSIVKKYSNSETKQEQNLIYEQLKQKFQQIKKQYLQKTKENISIYSIPFLPNKAFVTFKNKQQKNRVKSLYKYKINVNQLKFSLRNLNQTYQQKLFKVKSCHTQPVSIIWQNFHRKKGKQLRTTILISGFLAIILFFALIAILLLSIQRADLIDNMMLHPKQKDQLNLTLDSLIQHPTYQEAYKTHNPKTLYNFCSSLKLNYQNFHLQYYMLCQNYFLNFSQQYLTMFLMSMIVLCINLLLNYIIHALAQYRRHRTATQQKRFLIMNIFLVYFVNMVLLLLIIRADFSNLFGSLYNGTYDINKINHYQNHQISLINFVRIIFPQFMMHRKIQTYPQFNRKWYLHIGNQLIFNYIMSLVICPWLYIIEYWIFDYIKFILIKFKKFSKTQCQVNQILLSQQFDFQTYYAMLLVSFFFCMVFGTGMPIFYLLGALSFFSLYISSQFIFYHLCKVPQPFDHSINKFVTNVLVLGLALHQIMGIFFLYVDDIFPTLQKQQQNEFLILNKIKNGWVFIISLSFIMIFYFFKKQIITIVQNKYLKTIIQKKLAEEQLPQNINKIQKTPIQNNIRQINASQYVNQQKNASKQQDKVFHNHNNIKRMFKNQKRKNNQLKFLFSHNQQKQFDDIQRKYFYRLQDNPLYSNIFYTLSVFHKIVYKNQNFASSENILQQKDQNLNNQNQAQMQQQQNQDQYLMIKEIDEKK